MSSRQKWDPTLRGVAVGALVLAACLALPQPIRAAEETAGAAKWAPEGAYEAALWPLLEPVSLRRVVRNDGGLYDVWLVSQTPFDAVAEEFRKAISSRKALSSGLQVSAWSFLEPDRSYVIDLVGGPRPLRLRLSRHLSGALVEIPDVGQAEQAEKWAPAWRPQPLMLRHGKIR